jgi:hypothetical protein
MSRARKSGARARGGNPSLPPFEPSEVAEIREEIERAVGAIADRRGLRLQYDETAPTEKIIPIRFKLSRRPPQQKDLFSNPQGNAARRLVQGRS